MRRAALFSLALACSAPAAVAQADQDAPAPARSAAETDENAPPGAEASLRSGVSLRGTRELECAALLRAGPLAWGFGLRAAEPPAGPLRLGGRVEASVDLGGAWASSSLAFEPPQAGASRASLSLGLGSGSEALEWQAGLELMHASAPSRGRAPATLVGLGASAGAAATLAGLRWQGTLQASALRLGGPLGDAGAGLRTLGERLDLWPARASLELGPRLDRGPLSLALLALAALGGADGQGSAGGSLVLSFAGTRLKAALLLRAERLLPSGAWIGQLSLALTLAAAGHFPYP